VLAAADFFNNAAAAAYKKLPAARSKNPSRLYVCVALVAGEPCSAIHNYQPRRRWPMAKSNQLRPAALLLFQFFASSIVTKID
jgi:hypothetical protein